ncbi:hypothetical protein F4553_005090 [Allocatelliglobosispora scoriae]|uniref:Methyltransferase n=1 Tax=Allocatelliglobosispora scoriae TaxID=643052 RepID=A0A841BYG5_9ACTN|nr:SCO2525 family SAM-dependent methyltransferase [Allocatelliglobosispora scoriae]MBB5871711.1 hypothetical protein [Allocatelliglobosispora scoriae]
MGNSSAEALSAITRNSDYAWSSFNSELYCDHNYGTLRDDDHQIIEKVRDFFGAAGIPQGSRGLDVGPGANLYPAFTMLPFCERIDLREYSSSNVQWLKSQIADGYRSSWDAFWRVLAVQRPYRDCDPRDRLPQVAVVSEGSIFDLPARQWDVGTMFFVACSLSTEHEEFRAAVHRFIGALRPGAPFAAAFMVNSQGYQVGDEWFPAVALDHDQIKECLEAVAYTVHIDLIDTGAPLRDGYSGMMLATGRVAAG